MPGSPLVSVIIPAYNQVNWLVEAIESVFAQSFTDFELIVGDDGSSDGTVERLAGMSGRLTLLHCQRLGTSERVRDAALALSRAPYIALLDQDDLWQPDKLARQVVRLEQEPAVGLVYTDLRLLYADGRLSPPVLHPAFKGPEATFAQLLSHTFIHPSTVMLRRSLYDEVGPFARHFAYGETYFWLRAARRQRVACIPLPLVTVRRYAGSLSQQQDILAYQHLADVLEHLLATMPLSRRERFLARRSLARMATHVGLGLLARQEVAAARSHFLRSVRVNPWQRRAWLALGQCLWAERP